VAHPFIEAADRRMRECLRFPVLPVTPTGVQYPGGCRDRGMAASEGAVSAQVGQAEPSDLEGCPALGWLAHVGGAGTPRRTDWLPPWGRLTRPARINADSKTQEEERTIHLASISAADARPAAAGGSSPLPNHFPIMFGGRRPAAAGLDA
jgi:hypothetical protein